LPSETEDTDEAVETERSRGGMEDMARVGEESGDGEDGRSSVGSVDDRSSAYEARFVSTMIMVK
jgi:hypothetical protein